MRPPMTGIEMDVKLNLIAAFWTEDFLFIYFFAMDWIKCQKTGRVTGYLNLGGGRGVTTSWSGKGESIGLYIFIFNPFHMRNSNTIARAKIKHIFLYVSMYYGTDQGLNRNDWQAGFGPRATISEPLVRPWLFKWFCWNLQNGSNYLFAQLQFVQDMVCSHITIWFWWWENKRN